MDTNPHTVSSRASLLYNANSFKSEQLYGLQNGQQELQLHAVHMKASRAARDMVLGSMQADDVLLDHNRLTLRHMVFSQAHISLAVAIHLERASLQTTWTQPLPCLQFHERQDPTDTKSHLS